MTTTSATPQPPAAVRSARQSAYRSPRRELTAPPRDYLQPPVFATVATQDPDGRPHVVPADHLSEDGRFPIATCPGSRKDRNAAARPERVTVTVDDRQTLARVSAGGSAEILTGRAARDVSARPHLRARGAEALAVLGRFPERTEDVTIALTPARWRSWDVRSTVPPAPARAGIPRAAPERLFPS
ncbi:pyridoxamine 5'-phosphate oxidase family protein [Streptomyces sp. CC228A]|uniref:pyridoxamine 5'-phosphate oxidase family protein n=1 Tax=Streptomyces sp. CC228A TaxID=2898186 RepID=UPI001F41353C|nr:pyridoxamine 5'-phosphate oxidase family protein [Streptomyces sp. CC228A]